MLTDIRIPNLPDSDVGLVLVKNAPVTVNALKKLGVNVLCPEKNPVLPEEVSEHSDMLCFYAGGGVCVISPEQTKLKAELEAYGMTVKLASPLGGSYPADIALNFAASVGLAIGNLRYADAAVLNCINNKKSINVKQGYAKCSLCLVDEHSFITGDAGIASALEKNGANVLLISPDDVYLSEAHSGFFGGATGKLSKTELALNGSLKYHRDREKILSFLHSRSVEAIELFDGIITDIGGIIPLKEKK